MTTPLAGLATFCLALVSLTIGVGTSHPSRDTGMAGTGLVVHEWGTFTSVAGRGGRQLIWRPLTFESDLPSFVYSVDKGHSWRGHRYPTKSNRPVSVRMETPVLYFYSKEEATVRVRVGFPSGVITEWYPQASSAGDRGIDWGEVRIMPGAHFGLPNDFRENHYYPARETDAALVQVRTGEQAEHEKFLFYRGVGNFGLPLSVRLEGDKVRIANSSQEDIKQVVLFENSGGNIGYQILNMPETQVMVDRPILNDRLPELRQEIKAMLIANGLFEKEADAMLNTWRDSWFEEGLRVFYLMPRKHTDAILPIVIEPEPAGLVRVMVGRTEIITPEMEQNVTKQISRLSGRSISDRKAARREINKYGRFLESILTEILRQSPDIQLKTEVEGLLEEMK
ncbi:MAG: hypothetical protein ND895_06445 [Pyrinomonadaceae bacterium]|nr:hypothetical protein [Pyrinomonadaceae bacterium]